MNEGVKILVNSLTVFLVVLFASLSFGFFVYPNFDFGGESEREPVSEVLSVVDQQNPYAYECPGNFPVLKVPTDFPSIQQAIDSATSGAIISVAPGLYNEVIVLRPNVCLIAEKFGKTEIQGFSSTVIETSSNTQIKNFLITSLGKAEKAINIVNGQNVNIESNAFDNFKYGVFVTQDSKVSVNNNVFQNTDVGIFLQESMFFTQENRIEISQTGLEILDSEGEILKKTIVGGEYGVKATNSNIFFDKNIFQNQSLAGMQLCTEGDYEIGHNFFDNANEEILY